MASVPLNNNATLLNNSTMKGLVRLSTALIGLTSIVAYCLVLFSQVQGRTDLIAAIVVGGIPVAIGALALFLRVGSSWETMSTGAQVTISLITLPPLPLLLPLFLLMAFWVILTIILAIAGTIFIIMALVYASSTPQQPVDWNSYYMEKSLDELRKKLD